MKPRAFGEIRGVAQLPRTISEKLNYVVKCIDAYTVKSIASVSRDGLGDGGGSLASLLKADFAATLPQVQNQITNHYADLLANGRNHISCRH